MVINQVLKGTLVPFHKLTINSLIFYAHFIQHVHKKNVILKIGDHVHTIPLLSISTYFVLSHKKFSVVDLFICYIGILSIIRDPNFYRKPNLTLKHLTSYILTSIWPTSSCMKVLWLKFLTYFINFTCSRPMLVILMCFVTWYLTYVLALCFYFLLHISCFFNHFMFWSLCVDML